ncbi:hypothetical protein [Peristeroidobacter soli]|uniref:hypothetical protein n=1 Tax=Peristeroidobacter soli TaxID=2497877 RepID=UPI00101DBAB3|nr:hypothetical protein [Peristeroidobacter soli]
MEEKHGALWENVEADSLLAVHSRRQEPEDMPYGKLTVLALLAASIPVLAYLFGGYVFVSTFPYGAHYHSAVVSGSFISKILLLMGFLGLLSGLAYPALSLWFGERSRRRVLIVYGLTLTLGVALRYEARFLSELIHTNEEEKMALAYRALVPGALLRDARHAIGGVDSNIRADFANWSSFNGITGFPYDATKSGIEFSYPTAFPRRRAQSRIVAQLSAPMTDPDAVIERVILLRRADVQDLKPPLRPEEVRVYKGFLAFDDRALTFTPCGQGQSFSVNLSAEQREALESQRRAVVKRSPKRSFAMFTAAVGPGAGVLTIQKIHSQTWQDSEWRCKF